MPTSKITKNIIKVKEKEKQIYLELTNYAVEEFGDCILWQKGLLLDDNLMMCFMTSYLLCYLTDNFGFFSDKKRLNLMLLGCKYTEDTISIWKVNERLLEILRGIYTCTTIIFTS